MTRAMRALELGHRGEKYIFDLMQKAHRDPIYAPRGRGDIILDGGRGLSIEVKSATVGKSGRRRFQFCLRRVDRDGTVRTNAKNADLLILLAYRDAETNPAVFAIPTSRLNGTKTLKLPANLTAYCGTWSYYRNFDRAALELAAQRS